MPARSLVLDFELMSKHTRCSANPTYSFGALTPTLLKTVELTRLQVGPAGPVNLSVSTIAEAEFLVPYLTSCRAQGRVVNVLYGFPVPPSAVPRLAELAKVLGPQSVSVLVDHPDQLSDLSRFRDLTDGIIPEIFIKIDVGSRRAGISPSSSEFRSLLHQIEATERDGSAELAGLYCHAGHSYNGTGQDSALQMLCNELECLIAAMTLVSPRSVSIKLSAGASPTAMSIEASTSERSPYAGGDEAQEALSFTNTLRELVSRAREMNAVLEIHAGVYPVLDLQQLSIAAVDISWRRLGLSILAEIASIYPGRGVDGSTEALVTAGSLALGREPCKAYPGWGIVMPRCLRNGAWSQDLFSLSDSPGWFVERISQEHGILAWKGAGKEPLDLAVGQKVCIFPNHACIAAAGFDHFLVVDYNKAEGRDTIQDVWVSLSGW